MKKGILFTVVILCFTGLVIAQDAPLDNREKVQIGGKFGGSYSNVYDSRGEQFNADAKFGITGGAFVIIPISKYFGIQPELMITQKGFKAEGMVLGMPYRFKRRTTYLEIPVFFAFKPIEFVTLVAGPQFSYLVNQRDIFDESVTSAIQEDNFKQDNIRKNIFGLAFGADINLNHFLVGGRVSVDVQNNIGDGVPTSPRYKNVCAQLTLGYTFYK